MQLDCYVASRHGHLTSLFVRTGEPLPAIAGISASAFRLHRSALEVFPGQDRFLMDTAQVLQDIERQGWAIEALAVRFRLEDAKGRPLE